MGQAISWRRLEERLEPFCRKSGGRPPYPLPLVLRVHLMPHWYGLGDPAMEEALYENASMRQLVGLSLSRPGEGRLGAAHGDRAVLLVHGAPPAGGCRAPMPKCWGFLRGSLA